MQVHAAPVRCFSTLGAEWRSLEAEAEELSFFQSWTWVGCLAEERFPEPLLLRAESGGRVLGMALFNRHRRRLWLAESGEPLRDAPFVEHNAPLLACGAGADVLRGLLHAAWRVRGVQRLVLSGVAQATLRAAGGVPLRLRERRVPLVDLDAVRSAGGDYRGTLSANTRYQVRRSSRRYAGLGRVAVARADTTGEAVAWLDELVAMHGRAWRSRGSAGAFAHPYLMRFHRTLLARAGPRQEVDLLRISAGETALGYLYNFRLRGRVYAYQSGFERELPIPHAKPGLTSHVLAIERALAAGDRVYDFLAGADRYKQSLADSTESLWWAEMVPARSPLGWAARLRSMVRRVRQAS